MFNRVFGIGWLMAGVAAIYANFLGVRFRGPQIQPGFSICHQGRAPSGRAEAREYISEGAGAIILLAMDLNAFSALGFERGRYLGVLVNVLAVSVGRYSRKDHHSYLR